MGAKLRSIIILQAMCLLMASSSKNGLTSLWKNVNRAKCELTVLLLGSSVDAGNYSQNEGGKFRLLIRRGFIT
ncbi:Uncharacterised protein [Salmonella enterica subsp. arizonae]|nr:Uncharacterised protein [Salmonella enterica subsp. arizonae]